MPSVFLELALVLFVRLKVFDACYLQTDLRRSLQALQNFGRVVLFQSCRRLLLLPFSAALLLPLATSRAPRHLALFYFAILVWCARLLLRGGGLIRVAALAP